MDSSWEEYVSGRIDGRRKRWELYTTETHTNTALSLRYDDVVLRLCDTPVRPHCQTEFHRRHLTGNDSSAPLASYAGLQWHGRGTRSSCQTDWQTTPTDASLLEACFMPARDVVSLQEGRTCCVKGGFVGPDLLATPKPSCSWSALLGGQSVMISAWLFDADTFKVSPGKCLHLSSTFLFLCQGHVGSRRTDTHTHTNTKTTSQWERYHKNCGLKTTLKMVEL